MEEIAGGSEAELPKLQIPDTFVEAVEEKTGVELDLDAVDPEAEVETPAAEAETPAVETPAPEEAEVPETTLAEAPETPEAEIPEAEAEVPETPDVEAEAPAVETAPEPRMTLKMRKKRTGTTRKASSGATGTGKYRPDRTWMKTATSSTTAAICLQD